MRVQSSKAKDSSQRTSASLMDRAGPQRSVIRKVEASLLIIPEKQIRLSGFGEFAGQWIAWNQDCTQIVARGADMCEVRERAITKGYQPGNGNTRVGRQQGGNRLTVLHEPEAFGPIGIVKDSKVIETAIFGRELLKLRQTTAASPHPLPLSQRRGERKRLPSAPPCSGFHSRR